MEIRVPFDHTQQALSSLCPRETDGWGLPPPTRIEQYQRDIGPMAEGPLLEDVICLGPDGLGFDTQPKLCPPMSVSTFPLERRSRWAEPGLKVKQRGGGGSSPCSSSCVGIWESPHLSLDLGESPHPVS